MLKRRIKLILECIKKYKKYAIITPLFMIGEALMECILPFIMSALIDSIDSAIKDGLLTSFSDITKSIPYVNENLNITLNVTVLGLVLTLIVMSLISLACGILGGITAAKASVGLATNLRSRMYEKLQSFSFANIDKFQTSSLVTRMTTDIGNVQMGFQMCIRIVVRAPLMMIFSAIMAFISGGALAWIFVVLIPVVGLGLGLVIKKAWSIFKKVFKRYDALNESVNENISAIRVVKAFVRQDFEKTKFDTASNNMTGDFVKAEKIVALSNPIMNTTVHLSNILVIGLGSYVVYQSTINSNFWTSLTVGQMSSLLTYGIQILMNIQMMAMILVMLVMSLECIMRVGEVLEEVPTIKNPDNPIMEIATGDVQFKNVNFKYKDTAEKCALENINLTIKSGEFIGILGATGSGKTSLVNLISRLYDASEGEVIVSGHNVKEYDLKVLRDSVSVVLQKNVLFSGTVKSNLQWGNENATDEEMMNALKLSRIDDLIDSYRDRLDRQVEQGGSNFSGGQKQRLCIARAILKKPKILILDDSTSAVDTRTDKLIRKSLREELPHMTKIVIAQRISSIEEADQIIIMEDGKINQIGDHQTLIKTNKIYQDIYYTQNKVGGDK